MKYCIQVRGCTIIPVLTSLDQNTRRSCLGRELTRPAVLQAWAASCGQATSALICREERVSLCISDTELLSSAQGSCL